MQTKEKSPLAITALGLNPAWQKTLFFREFLPGRVNRAEKSDATASGKGINFVRACRMYGLAEGTVVEFLSGVTGGLIEGVLEREGLNAVSIMTEGRTRTCTTVLCGKTGMMTELIEPSSKVTSDDVKKLFSALEKTLSFSSGLAVCGTYPPGVSEDFYASAVRMASSHGKAVLADAYIGAEAMLSEGVDVLKINKDELFAMTHSSDVCGALRKCFASFKLRYAAITDGKEPAFFSDGKKIFSLKIPDAGPIVNPIGSGDTCSAVTFSEYLSGTPPLDAFRHGLAAATANCLTPVPGEFEKAAADGFFDAVTTEVLAEI